MEFDNVCTMIQGNLRSLQKSFGIKFCDVDRDHDEEVGKIAKTLESIVKERSMDQNGIRRMHMLLLLNTKWEHMAYFEEDKHYCHLLNSIPVLSRYLYFKLVSTLEWHVYLGEVILHFPEFLVREILTSLEADLKYIDSKCAVPFVYSLLSNLFHKIMYLQEHCKHRVTEFVKIFKSISKFNFEGIIAEMDCSQEKKHQYWGYVYRMLLDLVRVCIERIQNWEIKNDDFYAYSCEYNYEVWPQANYESCRGKLCLGTVANNCIAVSEIVSVHVYMSWMEVDIIEDFVEKTLQTCVRESAYKTRQAIASVPELHNSVAGLTVLEKRIAEIELKPVTEEDEIAKSDADTILMNLFNPKKTQAKWLRGLINIGIFESAPHMKVVSENACLIDADTMTVLLNSAVKYVSNITIEVGEHNNIINTLKTCLKALSPEDQLTVLSKFTKANCMMSPLESPSFADRVTVLFNKIVKDDENTDELHTEMVWLAIENCEALFKRAINECLASRHKAALILSLIQFIAPSADYAIPPNNLSLSLSHILTLMNTVKDSSSPKLKDDFLHIVQIACEMKICSAENLLYDHVIHMMTPAVSELKANDVNYFLDIITSPYASPLVSISTKCVQLLEWAMAEVESKDQGNDIKWLKSLAEKAPPLTTQYLGALLRSGDGKNETEDRALFWSRRGLGHGKQLVDLKPHERTELVTSTLKILPSLTMKEWERIGGGTQADFEQTKYIFFVLVDSLLVLLQVPAMMQNLACFGYIITNFIHYVKTILLPKMKTKKGKASVPIFREKILILSSVIPSELEESKRPQLVHLDQCFLDVGKTTPAEVDNNTEKLEIIQET
ncbi:hypothetical protein GE061_004250 [Apolygus lucorum]|uniref:Uncharacterized protein n=1 Tax=Apolygus lucorum TaxID=248454 RepID=A0A8S9X2N2_APOLU|nr:hypothetical protein GE061_004250 [Apolygus lucorum]